MGLRSLVPSSVQPKDIGNPIPSQNDTLAGVLQGFNAPQVPAQQSQNGIPPPQGMEMPIQRQPAQQQPNPNIQAKLQNDAMKTQEAKDNLAMDAQSANADEIRKQDDDAEFNDLLGGVSGEDLLADDALKSLGITEGKDLSKFKKPSQESFASFWDRFKVSVGRSKREQKNILDKIYGEGNVVVDDKGEFIIHDPKKKKSFQFDPDKVELGDIADAGAGTLEFIGNVAATVGASVFAKKAINAFNLTPGFLTSIGEFGATSVAGPVVGALGREAAVNMMEVRDPMYDATSQAMAEIGANMVVGAAFGLKTNFTKAMDAAAFGSDLNRIKQFSLMRNAIVDIGREFGLPNPTPGVKTTQKMFIDTEKNIGTSFQKEGGKGIVEREAALTKRAGLQFKGVVQKNIEDFQAGIGQLNEKAIKYAGPRKFAANNVLDTMDEFLSKILYRDENGIYHYPTQGKEIQDLSKKISTLKTMYSQKGDEGLLDVIAGLEEQLVQKGSMVAESKAVFGTHEGDKILKLMVDNYNALRLAQSNGGGVTMDALIKHTRAFERGASYDPLIFGEIKPTPEMNNMMKKMAHATIKDRSTAFDEVFRFTPEQDVWRTKHDKLVKKIDQWGEFAALAHPDVMGEEIVDKLFKAQDSEAVYKLRQILGDESTQWRDLKSSWLYKTFNEGFDENLMIPDPAKYSKIINSFSDDFLMAMGESGGEGALWRLRRIADKGKNISTSGLTPETQKNIKDLLTDVAFAFRNSIMGARAMFKLLGWNKHLVEYMNNEGFQNAIKATTGNAEREFLQEMEVFAHQATKDAKVIYVKGKAKLIPTKSQGIGALLKQDGYKGLPGAAVGTMMESSEKNRQNYVELQPE